mgnify:CR=1 FL=1
MASGPRRHHYPPRFYLNGFSRDDLLWIYDCELNEIRQQTPINTAVERDYYSIEDEDGNRNNAVEEYLSTVEDKARTAIQRLEAGENLNDDLRTHLSIFMALLLARTPVFEGAFNEHTQGKLRTLLKEMLSDTEKAKIHFQDFAKKTGEELPVTPEKLVEFVSDDKNYEIDIHPVARIHSMLAAADSIHLKFFELRWNILHAQRDTSFLCSNNPCVILFHPRDTPGKNAPIHGTIKGMNNPGGRVLTPLSQKIALLILQSGDYLRHRRYPVMGVRSANLGTSVGFRRFLIARDEALLRSVLKKQKYVKDNLHSQAGEDGWTAYKALKDIISALKWGLR